MSVIPNGIGWDRLARLFRMPRHLVSDVHVLSLMIFVSLCTSRHGTCRARADALYSVPDCTRANPQQRWLIA